MGQSKDEIIKMEAILKEARRVEESERFKKELEEIKARRQAILSEEVETIKKALFRKDKKGNTISRWDDLIQSADKAITQDVAAYNDWRNAMMGLLNMCMMLNDLLNAEFDLNFRQPLKSALIHDLILGRLVDGRKKEPTEFSLPALEHNVTFTPDNRLEIAPLMRSDGVDIKAAMEGHRAQLDVLFEQGIVRWLKDNHHYKPDPADKARFIKDDPTHPDHGKPLDKNTFDLLKNDPDHGLNAFLSGESELSFTPTKTGP